MYWLSVAFIVVAVVIFGLLTAEIFGGLHILRIKIYAITVMVTLVCGLILNIVSKIKKDPKPEQQEDKKDKKDKN